MAFKQVSFLPWTQFNRIIKLGPITFWPYYKEVDQRIRDEEVKNHLDKYFRSYVDRWGNPVETITICSYNNNDFRELNENEWQKVRNAVDVLIFASVVPQTERAVCSDNRSWVPPTTNVFELVTQNFEPGDDSVAIQAGSLCNFDWKIDDITFSEPWAKGGTSCNPEDKILKGFEKCFSHETKKNFCEGIFRSLEWFRMAHMEDNGITMASKVVMMTTAFEALLKLPLREQSKKFAFYIEKNIASDNFIRDIRRRKNKSNRLSLAGWWALDFYDLRTRIVHGKPISLRELSYKGWISHLIVTDLVFWECMQQELFSHGCIDDDLYPDETNIGKILDELFPDEQPERPVRTLTKRFEGFDDINKALGWVK